MKLLRLAAAICLLACAACTGKDGERAVYGQVDGTELLLDVHEPAAAGVDLRPAVILVHGGGWLAGSRKDFKDLGKWLAGQGYVAFSVDYRLVRPDANKWPAQLDDVQRAVRWVKAHAAEYRIDPAKVGAIGHSAGGHLVACLGTMDTRDNTDPALAAHSSRVACVVDLCGPTDLTDDFAGKVKDGPAANGMVDGLLGGTRAAARSASPLFHVDGRSAPFLIYHGTRDDIVPPDQSSRMHEALKAAGVESELVTPDAGHGVVDGEGGLKAFLEKLSAFLEAHLKG